MAEKKQRVDIRVEPELAEWAVAYAVERGSTKTAVYEAALRSLREDAGRGVPDLEQASGPGHGTAGVAAREQRAGNAVEARPAPAAGRAKQRPPRSEQSRMAMERMRRMDPRRYG
jgi:hypothetical protein